MDFNALVLNHSIKQLIIFVTVTMLQNQIYRFTKKTTLLAHMNKIKNGPFDSTYPKFDQVWVGRVK